MQGQVLWPCLCGLPWFPYDKRDQERIAELRACVLYKEKPDFYPDPWVICRITLFSTYNLQYVNMIANSYDLAADVEEAEDSSEENLWSLRGPMEEEPEYPRLPGSLSRRSRRPEAGTRSGGTSLRGTVTGNA